MHDTQESSNHLMWRAVTEKRGLIQVEWNERREEEKGEMEKLFLLIFVSFIRWRTDGQPLRIRVLSVKGRTRTQYGKSCVTSTARSFRSSRESSCRWWFILTQNVTGDVQRDWPYATTIPSGHVFLLFSVSVVSFFFHSIVLRQRMVLA